MSCTFHHADLAQRVQAQAARQAAQEAGSALEDAALDKLADQVQAGASAMDADAQEGRIETNETRTFIDGLKSEAADAAAVKQVRRRRSPCLQSGAQGKKQWRPTKCPGEA